MLPVDQAFIADFDPQRAHGHHACNRKLSSSSLFTNATSKSGARRSEECRGEWVRTTVYCVCSYFPVELVEGGSWSIHESNKILWLDRMGHSWWGIWVDWEHMFVVFL